MFPIKDEKYKYVPFSRQQSTWYEVFRIVNEPYDHEHLQCKGNSVTWKSNVMISLALNFRSPPNHKKNVKYN